MVKDHRDYERGNPLQPLYGYSFLLAVWNLLYEPSHRQNSTHYSTTFITPVVEHWMERETA